MASASDFRSYLAGVDKNLLSFVGNDGRIDPTKKGYDTNQGSYLNNGGNQKVVQDYVSGLYGKYQSALPKATAPPVYTTPAPYVPKLANFDVLGNYNKARATAEQAVNPTYDRYLNEFLAAQANKRTAKQNEVGVVKEANALELAQGVAGNAVNRARTGEDLTNSVNTLNEQETNMQIDSGTQYDTERRAMAEDVAGRGLTTSMGQGQMLDANNKRNLDEGRAVKEYNNQREAKKLLATRTIADLDRNDTDLRAITANKDKSADFDLESYLQDLSYDEQNKRNELELSRLTDISTQASTYEKQGAQSFLQNLAGQGFNSQDIALAYQMYA